MPRVPNEEKPIQPRKVIWGPRGHDLYRVKTGDTWVSIGKEFQFHPWGLIGLNFGYDITRLFYLDRELAARLCNWYLRHYVGCNHTDDGENWAFTSGLTEGTGVWKGGHILVPRERSGPPIIVDPSPPLRDTSGTAFSIRLVGGLGAGKKVGGKKSPKVGIAGDAIFFEIRNMNHHRQALFAYYGLGIGFGIASVSATYTGPWNSFSTSSPTELSEFAGPARFTTGGIYKWTWNWLHMIGVAYVSMETGVTVGGGASTTAGTLRFQRYVPYTP